MKNQHSIKFWATAFVTFVIASLIATSVFGVVAAESGDALRGIVVSVLLVGVVVLGCVLLNQAVKTKNKDAIFRLVGILSVYMVILLAFVYFDYKIAGSINLDAFDARLRFVVVNAIWIPATFTALVFFYFWRKARELYGKKPPFYVNLLEYLVGGLSFVGSAWGTFDAVYLLTNGDWVLALSLAVGVDFMLFLMGAWHLAANDDATATTTLIGKGVYTVIALAAQILDGTMRTVGATGNSESSQIGWTIIPFVAIGSGVFVIATYLIDKYNGGVSFGKEERESQRGGHVESNRPSPEPSGQRPTNFRPNQSNQRPNRPPQAQSSQKSQDGQHGTERFAEPEGLEEDSVKSLKELGWSGNKISKMTQAEADEKIRRGEHPLPSFITEEQKKELRELGYSDKLISNMKPQEAQGRLANKVKYREPQGVGQGMNGNGQKNKGF